TTTATTASSSDISIHPWAEKVVILNWIKLRSFFTVTFSNGCPCGHIIKFSLIVNRGGLDNLSGLLFGSFITRIYHCIT
ncbi:hypothetical protein GIB67_010073, partial [Kingdonia uniflora]